MFLVLFVVAIIPVMIGARIVGASNTGIGAAVISVIALTLIGVLCDRLIGNQLVNFLVAATLGGWVMSGILGTTFWRAIGVSVIAALIQMVVVVLFFGAMVARH